MTASELQAVSTFNTPISEQDLDLLSEIRTIRLPPATFRRLMLNARSQGRNRTEGLRYAIELGSLAPERQLESCSTTAVVDLWSVDAVYLFPSQRSASKQEAVRSRRACADRRLQVDQLDGYHLRASFAKHAFRGRGTQREKPQRVLEDARRSL